MDTSQTPGPASGEQTLTATVPTPAMDTAEGLTGEKTGTSFSTYANGMDGAGCESMMNMDGPGTEVLTDSRAGVDRQGQMSMQDMTGPQLGQPAHGAGGAGREPGHGTESPMSQYESSSYNSGVR